MKSYEAEDAEKLQLIYNVEQMISKDLTKALR